MKCTIKSILSVIASLCLTLYLSVPASASEVILSGTLTHTHTAESGNCYTPTYHAHAGTAGQSSANGCYTKASTTNGTCSPSKGACHGSTTWSCGGCGKTVTHTGWYVTGTCGQNHGSVYRTSSSCTCTASNNREDGLPGTHTYSKTVYDLGCGKTTNSVDKYNLNCTLSSCDYSVTKTESSAGLAYQISVSAADFVNNYLWEYYESGNTSPTISQNASSCLVKDEYDGGELYITITDVKGNTYTLETITVCKMKLVIIKDSVTHEIKKMFYDGQEIKHIDLNGVRLF